MVPAHAVPACWSADVPASGRPAAACIDGRPLALFRAASGVPRAVVDACPHRAYPLSAGQVERGVLRCAYHGWSFDESGACVAVPGRVAASGAQGAPSMGVPTRAAADAHGLTWVAPEGVSAVRVPDVATAAAPRALTLRWTFAFDAALADVVENILDVPHTAFLHGGLFRKPGRGVGIEARARRTADRLEVEYAGEPAPRGWLGRLLAPGGGVVTHVDRFVMPGVAQVEYALGARFRLLATTFLRADGPARTTAFHVVSLAPRGFACAVLPAFAPLAWHVLRQDARALRLQAANLARQPGLRYASTELDLAGPHVRQMLERASRGLEPLPDAAWRVTLAP